MNISFTAKQEKYISDQLESGDFKNASEVVRDALRLHQLYKTKIINELREEISKGWDGPSKRKSASDIASEMVEKHHK